LPPAFNAVVIWLDDERWLDAPIFPGARSRGESWVPLKTLRISRGMADQPNGRTTEGTDIYQ